jgi:hypothetical protein
VLLRRRHDLIGVRAHDALDEGALLRITRHHGDDAVVVLLRGGLVVETEVCLAFFIVGAVAEEAVLAQDRADLLGKVDGLREGGAGEAKGDERANHSGDTSDKVRS